MLQKVKHMCAGAAHPLRVLPAYQCVHVIRVRGSHSLQKRYCAPSPPSWVTMTNEYSLLDCPKRQSILLDHNEERGGDVETAGGDAGVKAAAQREALSGSKCRAYRPTGEVGVHCLLPSQICHHSLHARTPADVPGN